MSHSYDRLAEARRRRHASSSASQKPRGLSRRDALKMMGACGAVTAGSMMSQMMNLRLATSVMAAEPDVSGYKAVVCVFLFGGIDSYHLLVPNDTQGYADYVSARTDLAIPQNDLIQISDADGTPYGLHPTCGDLKSLFDSGDLGFVANVGSLIQPTTVQQQQQGVNVPLGLFSHNDQQQHWMTGVPQSRTQLTGWAGRMADVVTDASNSNDAVSMNISVNNLNILQTGAGVAPYVIGSNGASTLATYGEQWTGSQLFTQATDGLLNQTYSDLLNRTHARTRRNAIDAALEFQSATSGVTLNTQFPANNGLADQLRMVAQTIGGRQSLGQTRQTFFVAAGGWDHHDGVLDKTNGMFPGVAAALKAFNAAMIELGVNDDVTLFTASDFGRTLSSNGNGTDHAWGGNMMVMGGSVTGGKIHGQFPDTLAPGNVLDSGRGRLVPTTAVDQMAADLAMWFGIPNDDKLERVLPNIREFYGANESTEALGLFS